MLFGITKLWKVAGLEKIHSIPDWSPPDSHQDCTLHIFTDMFCWTLESILPTVSYISWHLDLYVNILISGNSVINYDRPADDNIKHTFSCLSSIKTADHMVNYVQAQPGNPNTKAAEAHMSAELCWPYERKQILGKIWCLPAKLMSPNLISTPRGLWNIY